MQTLSLFQLYTKLWEYINTQDQRDWRFGTCCFIVEMPVSKEDSFRLLEHFRSNRPSPTQHVAFYNHASFLKDKVEVMSPDYWWESDSPQRKEFLEYLTELVRPKGI